MKILQYTVCDRACENQSSEHKKLLIFSVFAVLNLITVYTTATSLHHYCRI